MFYQKPRLRLVFLSTVTLWVLLLSVGQVQAATAEAMTALGTGHWGLGVIGQGKFFSSSHLTSNEISQAKARDLDEFIEAESPYGWVLGVSQLKNNIGKGFATDVSSVSTRSYFIGLTAEATRNIFIDFMINFEKTDPINAYDNGLDFKFSYVVEWNHFKSSVSDLLSGSLADQPKKRWHHKKVLAVEQDMLTYPYVMLTLNPMYYQHLRKTNTSQEFQGNQAGVILSAKYFPSEKRAFRLFYSFFEYGKDSPRSFYSAEELRSLATVRAGPMGSMALLRTFPKHYLGFSFQNFTSGNFETELGINRTTYEVGGLGMVYNPNLSLFRFFPTQKFRLGGSLDLLRGGVTGYSMALHLTKYW